MVVRALIFSVKNWQFIFSPQLTSFTLAAINCAPNANAVQQHSKTWENGATTHVVHSHFLGRKRRKERCQKNSRKKDTKTLAFHHNIILHSELIHMKKFYYPSKIALFQILEHFELQSLCALTQNCACWLMGHCVVSSIAKIPWPKSSGDVHEIRFILLYPKNVVLVPT